MFLLDFNLIYINDKLDRIDIKYALKPISKITFPQRGQQRRQDANFDKEQAPTVQRYVSYMGNLGKSDNCI